MVKYELVGFNNNVDLQTLKVPLYVYLELTDSCNFNCKFCSVNKKSSNFIPVFLAKKVLDELKNNNIYDIYYTGGEPMLHPSFNEIIEYGNKLGFRQTVLTNGSLIKKKEIILDKITCVCISLHGSKKVHNLLTKSDNYDSLIDNIKLSNKYTNVKINYTVTSENQDISEMINVLELASKYNVGVSFAKYNNVGNGKRNNCSIDINKFVETLDVLKKRGYEFGINDCISPCLLEDRYEYLSHGCGAGYLFASITYDGNVKICPSSNWILGNISKSSFVKIWSQKYLKEYRKFDWIPLYCKSCKNLAKCRCGCKVELQNKITEFNDYNVETRKKNTWNKIKDKKMIVNISMLRKEKKDFINLSNPPRKYNAEAVQIIKKLNNGVIPEQIENAKDFILALYRDKLVKEVDDSVEKKVERR